MDVVNYTSIVLTFPTSMFSVTHVSSRRSQNIASRVGQITTRRRIHEGSTNTLLHTQDGVKITEE